MYLRRSRFALTLLAVAMLIGLPRAQAASPAVSLTISPASATITADEALTFVVRANHADGTTTDVTSGTTFSMNDPLGSMTAATYHAGRVGKWRVQASYQSFKATATIDVLPGALAAIDINPNSDPEYVILGHAQKFTAAGFDQHNNKVSGLTFSWSVVGEIGTIDTSGLFTPTAVGTGKIQAQSGSVTGQDVVVVSPAPVTNTNSGTNTSTVNKSTNVNRATPASNKNANTSSTGNTNTTAPTNTSNSNTGVAAASNNPDNTLQCTTLKSWLWILLLGVFLAAVALLYFLVPAGKSWPVVAALIGAGVLTVIQRKYGCSLQMWWAWIMILGTIGISVYALRRTPNKSV